MFGMVEEQKTGYSAEQYAAYMDERKALIEAARESARTFDQAVLAFGAAIFGASVAFLKDVAPHPAHYTLWWLAAAWSLFSCGLLAVLLSFIFSHKACMFQLDIADKVLQNPEAAEEKNKWSDRTNFCNYFSVVLLFFGLFFWSIFALLNLGR